MKSLPLKYRNQPQLGVLVVFPEMGAACAGCFRFEKMSDRGSVPFSAALIQTKLGQVKITLADAPWYYQGFPWFYRVYPW